MKTVGLDIGTYALKVVVGQQQGNKLVIEKALEYPNPVGSMLPADPQKRDQLKKTIEDLWQQNKLPTRQIRVSLPESMVVTKIVTMPNLSDAELASAIHWQVEQHVPISLEDLQYEYSVISRSNTQAEGQMQVLIIGVQKKYVQEVVDFLLDAGLDVTDLETDTLAQLRCLEPKIKANQTTVFVHLGANSSTVSIMHQGKIGFVYSFNVGGFLFTRAIEQAISLDPGRAEQYKRTYGLMPNQAEGKVRGALLPVMQSLSAEIQKALTYFASQNNGTTISQAFLSGGSIYLPDLFPYLSQTLSLEVLPSHLENQNNLEWKEKIVQNSRFVTAIGLALKNSKE